MKLGNNSNSTLSVETDATVKVPNSASNTALRDSKSTAEARFHAKLVLEWRANVIAKSPIGIERGENPRFCETSVSRNFVDSHAAEAAIHKLVLSRNTEELWDFVDLYKHFQHAYQDAYTFE